jgi:cell division protein FtsL
MTPLQIPTPGELQTIAFFFVLLVIALLVAVAVIVGLAYLITRLRHGGGDDRIAKLESRVEDLETENEELKAELESRR